MEQGNHKRGKNPHLGVLFRRYAHVQRLQRQGLKRNLFAVGSFTCKCEISTRMQRNIDTCVNECTGDCGCAVIFFVAQSLSQHRAGSG